MTKTQLLEAYLQHRIDSGQYDWLGDSFKTVIDGDKVYVTRDGNDNDTVDFMMFTELSILPIAIAHGINSQHEFDGSWSMSITQTYTYEEEPLHNEYITNDINALVAILSTYLKSVGAYDTI